MWQSVQAPQVWEFVLLCLLGIFRFWIIGLNEKKKIQTCNLILQNEIYIIYIYT